MVLERKLLEVIHIRKAAIENATVVDKHRSKSHKNRVFDCKFSQIIGDNLQLKTLVLTVLILVCVLLTVFLIAMCYL